MEDFATRAAIWLAMAAWTGGMVFREPRHARRSRWCWTVGWLAYVLHVVAAFFQHYDWSHAVA